MFIDHELLFIIIWLLLLIICLLIRLKLHCYAAYWFEKRQLLHFYKWSRDFWQIEYSTLNGTVCIYSDKKNYANPLELIYDLFIYLFCIRHD